MSDSVTAPEQEQQSKAADPLSIDTSTIPDEIPTEDVKGLKSAFEKLKAQVTELKGLQPKAALVDELSSKGINPQDLPAKILALQEQQKAQDLLEQKLAEERARAKAEQEQISQQYQGKISELTQELNSQLRRTELESVLGKAGGNVTDYNDFAAIAGRYIEFGDDQQIAGFKAPDGSTLYVDDEKQVGKVRAATVQDFILKAKSGEYGKALQSILPAVNQSSGAGLPGSYGVNPDGPIRLTQAQIDNMGSMSDKELNAIRSRGYTLIS